jgi:hypothetical protein
MALKVNGDKSAIDLINGNFKYHKNKQVKEKMYWRCWRKNCPGKCITNIVTNPGDVVIVHQESAHDHLDDSRMQLMTIPVNLPNILIIT